MLVKEVLDHHYGNLAACYDEFLYYSPQFVRALTQKMIEHLALRPEDALVDLGCGTGMYSQDILEQVPLRQEILGVDPYAEMLEQTPPEARIQPLQADALQFSNMALVYDKVLVKEAIHHVPLSDRQTLFRNLHRHLSRDGRLLLVHVPPKLDYPLFAAALQRCERWHADPNELESLLCKAGYTVHRDALDYQHEIPKETYFQMVDGRYMSVLSSFSDEEIRLGLAEMEERYAYEPTLRFVDHFDYIVGIRD
ncbi:MAG: class I SAM-dependent methyltransferase [Myxococcota bacterium]